MDTCYMCDKPAISREHVPPRCFFPEEKDLPLGINYRKKLITVPSCHEHNLSTSKDDEYLLAVILLHHQNNQVAYSHFMTKMLRTLRSSTSLAKRLVESSVPIILGSQLTALLNAESERINSEMKKIVCGVYYHHFKQNWTEPIMIDSPSRVIIGDEPPAYSIQKLATLASHILQNSPKYGDNPDIFYYQAFHEETLSLTIVKVVFYRGFELLAFSSRAIEQGLNQKISAT